MMVQKRNLVIVRQKAENEWFIRCKEKGSMLS